MRTGPGAMRAARRGRAAPVWLALWAAAVAGCRAPLLQTVAPEPPAVALTRLLEPSNERNWKPHMAVLPTAEWNGRLLTVHNIRNFKYITEDEYVLDYYDKTFDLDALEAVYFVVVPFNGTPSLAHTMLSFGFRTGDFLAVSVEVRLEEGESYSPLKGALRQYEIMYVVADERDLILLRTHHRQSDVYIYRAKATPEQGRALLLDVMRRVNKLAAEPEFYDTFTNNCTTNIVRHINRLHPGRVPWDWRILLPGYSDRLAYDLGLIETHGSFDQTRRRARVNDLAERYRDRREFSRLIRISSSERQARRPGAASRPSAGRGASERGPGGRRGG